MLFIFKNLTDIVKMIIREVILSFIYLSKLCFFYANKLDKTFDNPILIISKLLFVGLGIIIMAICQLISPDVLVLLTFYISWAQLLYLSLLFYCYKVKSLALQT